MSVGVLLHRLWSMPQSLVQHQRTLRSTNNGQQELEPSTWWEGATHVYMYVAESLLWDRKMTYVRLFLFVGFGAETGMAFIHELAHV